jgi:hypothetical protein
VNPSWLENPQRLHALSCAIALGIVAGGISAPAQAVNINPLGTGQVLVFPYYTVNAGNQTLISVVNNTVSGKAVKLRFREQRNARAAMDVQLYLSPFDVWTASVFSISDAGPDNPANLITLDNSCTVPAIKGNAELPSLTNGSRYIPFRNDAYSGANGDAGVDSLDRSRAGYFEMIEMGEVVNRERGSLTAITHLSTSHAPENCAQIQRAWLPMGAVPVQDTYWTVNALIDIDPPRGGLYGTAAIVDALAGTMLSYDADAIDGFSDIAQHTSPGSAAPSLATARTTSERVEAHTFSAGRPITSIYPLAQAVDAVSALFVQDRIFNEFVTSDSVGGASEWIATFPTKFAYTDEALVGSTAIPPFPKLFPITASAENAGIAAIQMRLGFSDREEGPITFFCEPIFWVPNCVGPDADDGIPLFHWASNIVSFNQSAMRIQGSVILGSTAGFNLPTRDGGVLDGWAWLEMYTPDPSAPPISTLSAQRMRPDQSGGVWNGLPVIALGFTSYTNGQLTPGVLSNYSGISRHRGSNSYQPAPGAAPQ